MTRACHDYSCYKLDLNTMDIHHGIRADNAYHLIVMVTHNELMCSLKLGRLESFNALRLTLRSSIVSFSWPNFLNLAAIAKNAGDIRINLMNSHNFTCQVYTSIVANNGFSINARGDGYPRNATAWSNSGISRSLNPNTFICKQVSIHALALEPPC